MRGSLKLHRLLAGAAVAVVVSSPMAAGACVYQVLPPPPACTQNLGSGSRPSLVVTNGQVICLNTTTVNGSILVQAGGAVLMTNGLVTGNVTTSTEGRGGPLLRPTRPASRSPPSAMRL